MADLDTIARSLAGVEQGIACAGTALESRTYRVGAKAFLFVSKKDVRLKLDGSAADARERGFAVGATSWVTLPLGSLPPVRILAKWVAESHSLMTGAPRSGGAASKKVAMRRRSR